MKKSSQTYKLYNELPLSKKKKSEILNAFNITIHMYGPFDWEDNGFDKYYQNILPEESIISLQAALSEIYPVMKEGKNSVFYKGLF